MEKKHIRLFAADLDGTLFSGWAKVSERAKEDLIRMRRSGIIVVICTGRPFYSVRRWVPAEVYDYAVCTNGQDIYDSRTDTHIYAPFLEESDVQVLTSMLAKYPMIMEAVYDDKTHHYAAKLFRPFLSAAQKAGTLWKRLQGKVYQFPDISSRFDTLQGKQFGKLCFASFHIQLKRFTAELDPDRYASYFTNTFWVEIMRSEVSKGNALQTVMERENIDASLCAAAGDGENDIPMMNQCAVRIAMANAMPRVKACATDMAGYFFKDGLAAWIEENIDY